MFTVALYKRKRQVISGCAAARFTLQTVTESAVPPRSSRFPWRYILGLRGMGIPFAARSILDHPGQQYHHHLTMRTFLSCHRPLLAWPFDWGNTLPSF